MSEEVGSGHIDVNYDIDDSALTRSFAKMEALQNQHWAGYKKLVKNSLDETDKNWDGHFNRQLAGMDKVDSKNKAIMDRWKNTKSLPNIHQEVELDTSRARAAASRLRLDMDQFLKDKHTRVELDTMSARLKAQKLAAELAGIKDAQVKIHLDDVEAKIKARRMKLELAELRDKHIEVKLDVDRSWPSRIGGVFRAITGMGRKSGTETGAEMGGGVARGLLSVLPAQTEKMFGGMGGPAGVAFLGALGTAIFVGLPAIGAMITGTLMAAVGSAGLAGAFIAVFHDPRIKTALEQLKQQFIGIFDQKTKDFIVNQFAPAFNTISNSLKGMAPYIQQIVMAGSTFAGPVANGIKMFAEGILPPLAKLMNSQFMKDIMNIFSQGFGRVGQTLGDFFNKILNDPKAMEGAKKGLNDLFDVINWLVKTTGDFIIKLSEVWDNITTKGPDGKSTLDNIKDVFKDIKTVVTDIIGLLKTMFDALGGNKAFIDQLKQEKGLLDQLTGNAGPNDDKNGKGAGKGRQNMPGDSFLTKAKKFGQNKLDDVKGGGNPLGNLSLTPTDFLVKQLQPELDKANKFLFKWFGDTGKSIRDWVNRDITQPVIQKWREFKAKTIEIWNAMTNSLMGWLTNIKNWFTDSMRWIKDTWHSAWTWIRNTATAIWNGLQNAISTFWNWVTNAFNASLNWIRGVWNEAWGWVKNTAISIWNGIQSAVATFWGWVQNAFNAALNWIRDIWSTVWNWVSNTAITIWNGIRNALEQFWAWIQAAFNASLSWIKGVWNDAWGAVKQFFTDTWNSIWDWIQHRWEDIKNLFNQALEAIKKGWNDAWDGMHKAFMAVWDKIKTGAIDGMNGVIGHINSAAKGINGVIEKLGLSFKIPTIDPIGGGSPAPGHAEGGPIRGNGTGTSDGELAWLSHNEHVWTAKEVDSFGGHSAMEDFRRMVSGYATGGSPALKDGRPAYAGGGMTSTQAAIVEVAKKSGIPFTVNSAFRPGSVSLSGNADYHSRGMAVDFGSPNMPGLAAFFMRYASALLEEIHSSGGGFFVKNGHRVGNTYYGNEVAGHFDHVHIAATLQAMEAILGGKVPAGTGDGGGGILGFLNEFIAKGWGWVMGHMLGPAFEKLTGGWAGNAIGQIGAGTGKGLKADLEKKIKELFDEAETMASALGAGGAGMAPSDGAKHWTSTIIQALQMTGTPSSWLGGMLSLITRESGGNPTAINRTDINAKHGDPSRGLTQTIGATFNKYKMPGHDNIYGPLDNILASIRYIKARYGSVYNGPAQAAYDNGGLIPPHSFAYNGSNVPELALNAAQGDALRKRIEGSGEGHTVCVHVDGVAVAQRHITVEEIDKNNHALLEHITKL